MRSGKFARLTVAIAFGSGLAEAQMRPATTAEVESIRASLMLDEMPERRHLGVLEVQGAFTQGSGERPDRLDGWVYFVPYLVQSSVCMMEARFVTGLGTESGYDWSVERFAYWNWLAGAASECEIEDRSDIPRSAVQSSEPIPSSALSSILSSSEELLTLAYRHIEAATELSELERESVLRYRSSSSYRLDRIELTEESAPEYGFAYRATYRAAAALEGPTIVFSVTSSGFVIHAVGKWVA